MLFRSPRSQTPVKIAFVSMFLNAGLNYIFMRPLENGKPALATSLTTVFDSGCLVLIFWRRYGSIGLGDVARSLAKFLACALAMALVTLFVVEIPGFYAGKLVQRLSALTVTILAAGGTYFACALLLRAREVREVWGMYGFSQSPLD